MGQTKKHTGIRIFLLALFMSYFADVTFFTHTHLINGVTIVHSHFSFPSATSKQEQKSPGHTHSANTLTLISHAAAWTALLPPPPSVPENSVETINITYPEGTDCAEHSLPATLNLRGPPEIVKIIS